MKTVIKKKNVTTMPAFSFTFYNEAISVFHKKLRFYLKQAFSESTLSLESAEKRP